jgi:hypothetical protein
MKTYLLLTLLLISIKTFSNHFPVNDTVPYWKVYNGGKLLSEGNITNQKTLIIITKHHVRAIDTLTVEYFEDVHCINCNVEMIVKTNTGKEIKKIKNTGNAYLFKIKTTEIQVLAFNNKSAALKFYFKKHKGAEVFLFEIRIQ